MRFCFTELLLALSYALDCVERDLLGVATHHGKRVAYLCVRMGERAGLDTWQLSDLAACAVLHDNALTEYIQAEYLSSGELQPQLRGKKLGIHCSFGERNVKQFPFFGDVENVILYHHENADGSGPFGRKAEEVPFYAALVHLADQVDAAFHLNRLSAEKYEKVAAYLRKHTGRLFAPREVELFFAACSEEALRELSDARIDGALRGALTYFDATYTPSRLMHLAGIFARIIDYKSTFTSLHSMGIAHKAEQMGIFYRYDEETRAKLFLAGAFHDIGKLVVDVKILEKPGALTEDEFEQIKEHARQSWRILSSVRGFEDIARWGALHHEKLDGSGYPFGYQAAQLGFMERLMACLDIYQALREDRPYKKGFTHEKALAILRQMAAAGAIDAGIVEDVDAVFGEEG